MSSREDMLQCECRNSSGYPAVGDNFRGYMNAPIDNSVNKPLPWIVLACIIGSLALMGVIMMPSLIDAKVSANAATCDLALKTAYTAKDQTDLFITRQKAKEEKANAPGR